MFQGNELRSPGSRILRERNVDRRTTTTPHSLRYLFTLKRQDEVSMRYKKINIKHYISIIN